MLIKRTGVRTTQLPRPKILEEKISCRNNIKPFLAVGRITLLVETFLACHQVVFDHYSAFYPLVGGILS
jgi:hypothetical protein